jgi:hypothetical protein
MGQLTTGLVNGNYSGTLGSTMNPSLMANTRLKTDILLFSAAAYLDNNYFYLPAPEANFQKLVFGEYAFPFYQKPYGTGERNVYTYYEDRSLKNVFIQDRIIGPSAMVSYKDHVFAFRWGARVASSVRRLPYDMANFSFYGMDFKPQQNVYYIRDNYEMASMAWWDMSFSYATVIKRSRNNHWSAGVSFGPVFGYAGSYVTGRDTRYIAYNDSILNVELLDAEFGISLPANYETDQVDFANPLVRGLGWGLDVGITWQWREKPYQKKFPGNFYIKRFEDYRVKLGISILDIGWIGFTKNAEKHVYDMVHNNHINVSEMEYDNIATEIRQASEIFYGDPNASLDARSFRIFLPTAFSAQLDYHITDWWFINSTLVIPAWFTQPGIERPVILTFVPRFESDQFEVNIPVVFNGMRTPYVGISVRIAGLTVGSDRLGSFFGRQDFTGADIYISYKINFLNDGKNPFTSKGACYNDWRQELRRYHKD